VGAGSRCAPAGRAGGQAVARRSGPAEGPVAGCRRHCFGRPGDRHQHAASAGRASAGERRRATATWVCRLVPAWPSWLDTPGRARARCVASSRHDRHGSTHPRRRARPAPRGSAGPAARLAHRASRTKRALDRPFRPGRASRADPARRPGRHAPPVDRFVQVARPVARRRSHEHPARAHRERAPRPPDQRPFRPRHTPPPPSPGGASTSRHHRRRARTTRRRAPPAQPTQLATGTPARRSAERHHEPAPQACPGAAHRSGGGRRPGSSPGQASAGRRARR
jgi:hypothetical protein